MPSKGAGMCDSLVVGRVYMINLDVPDRLATRRVARALQVIAGKAKKDDLRDVLTMVRNTTNPQVSIDM